MTQKECLDTIKLLSALESWALSKASTTLPDYLWENLERIMNVLEREVLRED